MRLTPGMVVADRFELEGLVGRGGMGSVWRARHLRLDIPCAVKFIEGVYAHSHEATQRFEREAKAAALLRSPHVVQILDHGVWEDMPYIAMELLEGEDLGKRLVRVGRLGVDDTLAIVDQVARALQKAGQAGIVHRDLKPDNVFLVHDGDRELVKVLDFGVAKRSGPQGASVTRDGAVIGTPMYMSPEQARGLGDIDARSDLWSLAVIVFECLTGKVPFDAEAVGDLMVQVISGPVPVPSTLAPIPPGFDAWWARAASRDRSARFQTARELHDELAVAFGKPRPAPVTPLAVRGGPSAPSHPALARHVQEEGDPHAPTLIRGPRGQEAVVAATLAPLSEASDLSTPMPGGRGAGRSLAKRAGLVAAVAAVVVAVVYAGATMRSPPATQPVSASSAPSAPPATELPPAAPTPAATNPDPANAAPSVPAPPTTAASSASSPARPTPVGSPPRAAASPSPSPHRTTHPPPSLGF